MLCLKVRILTPHPKPVMTDDKQLLNKFLQLVADYKEQRIDRNPTVVNYQSPMEIRNKFDFTLGEGVRDENILNYIEDYLKYAVNTGSKQFFNQLFAGHNLPAFMGDVITSLTNTSMYTYEVSPVATMMEHELIQKMCTYVGFTDGEGTFGTGGSNTNMVAMICARNAQFPESKKEGMWGMKKITAFVSEEAHYSFGKAANAMGIGTNSIVKVKADKSGKLIPEELEKEIQASKQRGEVPFFIAATAATTELGAFDPFDAMADIAQKYNIWFHVDGSWGGSIILSSKYKHLFTGLERADSFSWNPHKLMNIPLICSVLLINKKGILYKSLSAKDTDYIFHDNENAAWDLGRASLQCGKRNDALKLWMAWKYYGDNGYEQGINNLMDLAEYATNKVRASEELELMAETQTLNINFRYNDGEIEDLDAFNEEVRETLLRSGKSMVNYVKLDNGLAIRLVLVNHQLTKADIDLFFENYLNIAHEVKKSKLISQE